jgi:hypothetical protein
MQPRLRDNISRGNRVSAYLNMRGRTRTTNGGERVQVALMHAQNSTADIYAGYGLLNTTPQEGITSAFFDWAQLSVSIAISRKEERQNSGQSQILGLLQAKTMQAEVTLKELYNNCIVAGRITASTAAGQFLARIGKLDSGALGPLPLGALVDYTPSRSVSIGNINGNTYPFWRNQAKTSAATTYAGMRIEMDNLYNTCSRGVGGSPDLGVSDQVYWETYHNGLQAQERYVVTDSRVIDILGGTDALKFRGMTLLWDEVVPDVATNAEVVDGIGSVSKSTCWFLNSESLEIITDSETDFITTPFVRPQDQDAKVAQILWMGAMGVNNRRKNGVHGNVSQTITT